MKRNFFKRVNAQKLQSSVQGSREVELLVKDGLHKVNGHGDPDLRPHSFEAGAEVIFDTQMTFDPAEEECASASDRSTPW